MLCVCVHVTVSGDWAFLCKMGAANNYHFSTLASLAVIVSVNAHVQ